MSGNPERKLFDIDPYSSEFVVTMLAKPTNESASNESDNDDDESEE